jgi:hypothetical protein
MKPFDLRYSPDKKLTPLEFREIERILQQANDIQHARMIERNGAMPSFLRPSRRSLIKLGAGAGALALLSRPKSLLAATNFLEAPGTNGFITTPFALMGTTDLSGLANANGVTSTASALSQTTFSQAIWTLIYFQAAGAFTPTAGGYLAGWWLQSDNGGTNYEKVVSNTDLPRSPDFIIPMFASAYASGDRSWAGGLVKAPFPTVKAFVMNHSGVTLSANNHLIQAAPVAIQY